MSSRGIVEMKITSKKMHLFIIERMYGFPNSCSADFAASCLPSFFIPFVGVLMPAFAIIVFAKFVETTE